MESKEPVCRASTDAEVLDALRLGLVGSRSSSTDTRPSNGWIVSVAQDITGLKREGVKLRDAHVSALVEAQTV